MDAKELKEHQTNRAKMDFQVQFLNLINNFESVEEPEIILTKKQKIHAVMEIITKELGK